MKSSIPHSQRKSFKKWAMTGQRMMTSARLEIVIRQAKSKNPRLVGRNGYKITKPQAGGVYPTQAFYNMFNGYDTMLSRHANRGRKSYSISVPSKGLLYSSTKNHKGFQSEQIKPNWKHVSHN